MYDSWEPKENLGNCKPAIRKYERKLAKKRAETQAEGQKSSGHAASSTADNEQAGSAGETSASHSSGAVVPLPVKVRKGRSLESV